MAFIVDTKSWSVDPSVPGRLALVGVFGIDMSDLLLFFGRINGTCGRIPRLTDCMRDCGPINFCHRLLNAHNSS